MREDVETAVTEALETSMGDALGLNPPARQRIGERSRGRFLLRLRRLLENLPPDVTLEDLRDEVTAE